MRVLGRRGRKNLKGKTPGFQGEIVKLKSCVYKSPNSIGISIIDYPFWGTPIFGNTHMYIYLHITHHLKLSQVPRDLY